MISFMHFEIVGMGHNNYDDGEDDDDDGDNNDNGDDDNDLSSFLDLR